LLQKLQQKSFVTLKEEIQGVSKNRDILGIRK